jgi:hypothetical protein
VSDRPLLRRLDCPPAAQGTVASLAMPPSLSRSGIRERQGPSLPFDDPEVDAVVMTGVAVRWPLSHDNLPACVRPVSILDLTPMVDSSACANPYPPDMDLEP